MVSEGMALWMVEAVVQPLVVQSTHGDERLIREMAWQEVRRRYPAEAGWVSHGVTVHRISHEVIREVYEAGPAADVFSVPDVFK